VLAQSHTQSRLNTHLRAHTHAQTHTRMHALHVQAEAKSALLEEYRAARGRCTTTLLADAVLEVCDCFYGWLGT
jgi:hypothetical protein